MNITNIFEKKILFRRYYDNEQENELNIFKENVIILDLNFHELLTKINFNRLKKKKIK